MRIPAGLSGRARGWVQWGGWRRLGVAAGSVAVHVAVLGLIALSLGASRSEEPSRELRLRPPMALDFVMLDLPMPEAKAAPQPEPDIAPRLRERLPALDPAPAPPRPEPPRDEPPPSPDLDPPKPEQSRSEPRPSPEPPRPQASVTPPPRTPEPRPAPAPAAVDPRKDKDDAVVAPAPAATAPAADAGGSIFLPPSSVIQPGGGPAGLRNLAYGNPCESRFGKKPKECVENWRGRVGEMDSVMPRSEEDLRRHFADYIKPCPDKVGCDGGEWISTNGTRAPSDLTSAAAGGAASVGGINDLVGRLPQQPDFVDPGFGD